MDRALIERLAGLRGVGEAYHNYRGELKHFSLETKAGILSAMGCPTDEDGQLAQAIAQTEAARLRKFLPPVATAHGARIGFDINVTAREFGATIVWRLVLEDGSRIDGATSTADCAEVWRGEISGSWVTRRRFELARDLPPGYHEFEARISGGVLGTLSVDCFAAAMLRAGGDCRRQETVGNCRTALLAALARQLGHGRFSRSGTADSLGRFSRRRVCRR